MALKSKSFGLGEVGIGGNSGLLDGPVLDPKGDFGTC